VWLLYHKLGICHGIGGPDEDAEINEVLTHKKILLSGGVFLSLSSANYEYSIGSSHIIKTLYIKIV